jgi:hypothetical protein
MSLLGDIGATVDADVTSPIDSSNVITQEQESSPNWWLDDERPGDGERPGWLPEKFKSAADLSKAYGELEQKFSKMPDEYDLKKADWIDPDYEPLQEFADFARKNRVPNEVMDKMFETVGKYLNEFKVDYSEEKSRLGDNAQERLELVNNWAKANLSEDSYYALTSNLRTADTIIALEELRAKMLGNNTMIPPGNESHVETATVSDIEHEMQENLQKYQTDPRYRAEITRKFEQALAKEQR